ncbi:HAD family hydrolase [Niallia sp. 01092]|uniref:HAD family hydrolase n=1 Tax=unclassified Niallia TaxID=2837522 RepID=UPI003FD1104C
MTIKALVLDMDGTMLNKESRVSPQLSNYLTDLRKTGLKVFIATGRTILEVKDTVPEGFEVDGIVTSNGMSAFINGKQLFQHSLTPSLVDLLIEETRERGLYYEIHPAEGERYVLLEDKKMILDAIKGSRPLSVEEMEWRSRKAAVEQHIQWKEYLDAHHISKIYFFHKKKETMDAWISFLKELKQEAGFTYASSTEHNVEVTAENINKATGVKYLLDHFLLSFNEVLAVGDGENDLPLLQRVGYSVAMQNATDSVKAHVDEITELTYKEAGLYHYLSKRFK